MTASFAIRHVPTRTFERLISTLVKGGQEYWLYGEQNTKPHTSMIYVLRDQEDKVIQEWRSTSISDLWKELKISGFEVVQC